MFFLTSHYIDSLGIEKVLMKLDLSFLPANRILGSKNFVTKNFFFT